MMELSTYTPELTIIGRVAYATLIGLCIGIERHYNGNIAGVRTFSTMALATSLVSLLAIHFFTPALYIYMLAAILVCIALLSANISVVDDAGRPEFSNRLSLWATGVIAMCIALGLNLVGTIAALLLLIIYIVKDFIEDKTTTK